MVSPNETANGQPVLITGGHVVDPASGLDGPASVLIRDGKIDAIHPGKTPPGAPDDAPTIDATDKHIFPGLVDARVYVGEPGGEHRETIASASRAAAAGGVTSFIMMPETDPVIDDVSLVDFVRRAARDDAEVRIYPAAAITRGFEGKELTEYGLLKRAGAVMLTEGKRSLRNNLTFRRALTYAKDFGLVIAQETNDPDLSSNGVMNEGLVATHLGLPGIPREAEIIALERDLRIAHLADADYHAAQISTATSAEAIAYRKKIGQKVSCGISINHLSLNENDIGRYRTYLKLSPPLALGRRSKRGHRCTRGWNHRHHRLQSRSPRCGYQTASVRGGSRRRHRPGNPVCRSPAALSRRTYLANAADRCALYPPGTDF